MKSSSLLSTLSQGAFALSSVLLLGVMFQGSDVGLTLAFGTFAFTGALAACFSADPAPVRSRGSASPRTVPSPTPAREASLRAA